MEFIEQSDTGFVTEKIATKPHWLHSAPLGFDCACVLVSSPIKLNATRQTYGAISARLTARLASLQIMCDQTARRVPLKQGIAPFASKVLSLRWIGDWLMRPERR